MIKLSIIVPVYNVEKYIIRCLESLKDLNISNEIIVVNDGSTDSSKKLAEEFKEKNPEENIIVITQENKGLSGARNTGLKEAKGEYISFIDSDDFIVKEKYEELVNRTIDENLDIGIGNAIYYYENENERNNEFFRNKNLKDYSADAGIEWMKILSSRSSYRAEVWDDIYKREFLIKNNISFIPGRLHEDHMFTLNAFLKAERVKYFDLTFYNYVQRDNSIMTTKKIKNYDDMKKNVDEMKDLYEKYKDDERLGNFFPEELHNLYKSVIEGYYILDKEKYKKIKKEYKKFYKESMLRKRISRRYKTEGFIICISYYIFSVIKKMIKGK